MKIKIHLHFEKIKKIIKNISNYISALRINNE